MAKLRYAIRIANVAWRSPMEVLDRIQGRLQVRAERKIARPTMEVCGDYLSETHRLLGLSADCSICAEFEAVWRATEATLANTGHITGKGYDGGLALASVAYTATRHLNPEAVVETGVARGITSRAILEALNANDHGQLFSIDLPPLTEGWDQQVAVAVSEDLNRRWTYLRGSSRRLLAPLLRRLGSIPLFVHDSLHTYKNMNWEIRTAWDHIDPGGLIICDDVEDNSAFADFTRELPTDSYFVAQEPKRTGLIGAIRKVT